MAETRCPKCKTLWDYLACTAENPCIECGYPNDCETQLATLRAESARLAAALRKVEFDARGYCEACNGWMVGPNGATPKVHTKDCPVALALSGAPAGVVVPKSVLEHDLEKAVLMAMEPKLGQPGTKADLIMHHRICKAVRALLGEGGGS